MKTGGLPDAPSQMTFHDPAEAQPHRLSDA
jgi:hypothetical protein